MLIRRCMIVLAASGLAACGPQPDNRPGSADQEPSSAVQKAASVAQKTAAGDDLIACALGGMKQFDASCEVQRSKSEDGLELTVRHPDGVFRRFVVLQNGQGLATADGAHEAQTRYADGHVEVAIENDRYRFPTSRKRQAAKP